MANGHVEIMLVNAESERMFGRQLAISRRLVAGLGLVVFVILGAVSYKSVRQLAETLDWVRHTYEVLAKLREVNSDLMVAQAAVRGFVITGRGDFLTPYQDVLQPLQDGVRELRRLTADNPRQQERLSSLEDLIRQRLALSEQVLDLQRRRGFVAAAALISAGGGQKIMKNVGSVIGALEQEERDLLTRREAQARTRAAITFFILPAGTLIGVSLLVAVLFSLNSEANSRRRAEAVGRLASEVLLTTSDAVITKTLGGIITSWNPGAEQIFGYTAQEVIGLPVLMFIPPDCANEETKILTRIGRGERVEPFETVRLRKDGRRANVSVTVSPLKDNTGNVTGAAKILRDITGQKQAEDALRASEERFKALEQNSWDAVHLLSSEGIILYESPSVIRVLGYDPEELVGRNSFELVHPDDSARVGELFAPLAATPGLTLRAEVRIHHKDGSWPWMDCVATNLLEHPAVRAIAVNYRDVTERKRAEAARRESEERLNFALQTSKIGAWELSLLDNTANRTLLHDRIFGYEALLPLWTYEMFLDHVLPADREDVDRSFREATTARDDWSFECRIRRADGEVRWIWAAGGHELDAAGKATRMSGIVQDITRRKQAEEGLRASEGRYRSLFENAPDGILIADSESTYLDANTSICHMLGYTSEELIGLHATDIVAPLEFEQIEVALNAIRTTSEYHREWQFRRKDGSVFVGEVIAAPMPDGNVVGIIRDVSARLKAEAALREGEERFRTMANTIPQLAWIARPDGFIDWYNERWYEYTGTTPEQMEGWGWQTVHHPEALPKVLEKWTSAMGSGQPLEMEFPLRAADGKFRTFLTRVQPLKNAEGRVLQWFGTNTDVDELKRMEESLRASQTRLKSTLEAGSIGTWTWDIVHDRLAADEFTARMFSIEPDSAAIGLPAEAYLRAVKEEDQPRVADALSRAIHSCGRYDIEYRVPQKDGELRWLQARGRVEGDTAGNALNFHGAVMDITERKRTEGRFRRLVDSNAQGVMFWNTKGEITGANDAFLRIVGYTRADLEAGHLGWAAMTPPEYAHLDQRSLEELVAKGICTPFEKEYIRKDGSRVPILLGAAVFEDSPEEGVCFLIDITERKRTDQALHESEEHFHFLNDLSEATRTLVDPGQIMAVTARMLGEHLRASRCAYADVEADGDQFTILHDYTDGCASTVGNYQLSLFGPRAVATLHSGQTLIIRNVGMELLNCDGADMFNAIGINAIITCPLVKEGRLRAMMAVHQTTARNWKDEEITIVQDVVERCWATIGRRAAEEGVHQLNADLEQRVAERTTQLEAANKELEAFSYSVSHDLRAPLRTVDGFSQAVMEDYGHLLPDEGRRFLQTIREGGQRMGALIDDLLDFARLSRKPLNKRIVATEKLVREVIEDLASQREGRQIEIRIGDLPPCQGDPALLKQVWVNLLSNAHKYTRNCELAVLEIGCTREKNEDIYSVRDNGTGFDMRYIQKLFGVFQRLHRAEDYEGTGVGLAIVQRVIHRHGGRVWAEAAVGCGATFYFTLEG